MTAIVKRKRRSKAQHAKLEALIASQAHLKDPNARPYWEIAAELAAQIPAEEWAKVPTDLSMYTDHYLYGTPKDEQ